MLAIRCLARSGGSRAAALFFLVLLACGCGGRKTGAVSGKVRLNGKEVPDGFVNFFPEGQNTAAKISRIKSDGSYSISGIPVGKVRISVQGVRGSAAMPNMEGPKGPQMPRSDRKTVYVPAKYSTVEQSGLSYDVKAGSQEYPIDLTDP